MKRTTTIVCTAIVALSAFVLTALNSCKKPLPPGCYDPVMEAEYKSRACTAEYDPVKGCDGKTYGNACGARAHGITSYEEIR